MTGDTRYQPVAGLLDECNDDDDDEEGGSNGDEDNDDGNYSYNDKTQAGSQASLSSSSTSSSTQPIGDGSHLFGREPRKIALQCSRLELPRSLAEDLGRWVDRIGFEDILC